MQQVELAKNKMAKAQAAMEGLAATNTDLADKAKAAWADEERIMGQATSVKPLVRSPVKNTTTISPERQAIMDQQKLLNQQLGTNLKVDGIMGPQTQKAMNTMQGRREADLARAVQAEAATMAPQQQQQQMVQPTAAPKQQGWTLDKEATDKMHQQWLNNELPEGSIPTAVYNGPSEGLAAKFAGWFK
jgi:peptidoglycan hydrolase-like protein with peptidoglycan-binding domain